MMLRLGINRSLWIFGVLQALSTACFAILAQAGNVVSLLAGVIGVCGQTLDRRERRSVGLFGADLTGPDCLAAPVDRAGTANPEPASVFGSGKPEVVAQDPQERDVRRDLGRPLFAVDDE